MRLNAAHRRTSITQFTYLEQYNIVVTNMSASCFILRQPSSTLSITFPDLKIQGPRVVSILLGFYKIAGEANSSFQSSVFMHELFV